MDEQDEQPESAIGTTVPLPPGGEDGSAVWTIPLQVSVRLGQPALTAQAAGHQMLRDALAEATAARTRPYYDEPRDRRERDRYYQGLPRALDPTERFARLHDLLRRTHTTRLRYAPGEHIYPVVDLRPNLKLQSIYSGREFTPEELIRSDFEIAQLRAARLRERTAVEPLLSTEQLAAELGWIEAQFPFNCEHVVPQSWFRRQEHMRGDLHHLFACEPRCNTFRSNTPYFDFPDFGEVAEATRHDCGRSEGNKFEPLAGKGPVARATLYFLLRYPGEINRTSREYEEERLQVLLAWHEADPVTVYERHRNTTIQAKQGNRNPLIDFPAWATGIDFRLGLGT